jgi:hypothetical protein
VHQVHQISEPPNRINYELPLRKVSLILNLIVMLLGLVTLSVGVGLILAQTSAWILSPFVCWFGFICIATARIRNVRPVSRSPNDCLPSSLFVCLEYVGYPWDIAQLEQFVGLNIGAKGTPTDRVFSFLRSRGVSYHVFDAKSLQELQAHLHYNRTPCVAIVERPLFDWNGWGFVVMPWRILRRQPKHQKHAVVVFGVERDKVLVFDPFIDALYRVRWKDVAKELFPGFGTPFLSIQPD